MREHDGSGWSLGQVDFGNAELGDRRRSKRLAAVFEQIRKHPGGTLPGRDACGDSGRRARAHAGNGFSASRADSDPP